MAAPDTTSGARSVLVCSCENTMPLDMAAIARGCGGAPTGAESLCRRQLDLFRAALAGGGEVVVGCTQEQPLFTETAAELGRADAVAYANLRETGGWSRAAADAGPKMAALLAAAAEAMPQTPVVTLESKGVALIYGRDAAAIDAGRRLADQLDITVLLHRPDQVTPPARTDFPVLRGTIRGATGHLGAFDLGIDDFALPAPSSRAHLVFGPGRDGARSRCDVLIDLSGGAPLFPAHALRPGYLRADPGDRAAIERALFDAAQLVGTFDKPRYVDFDASLCAHARSRITGCTRCLELCPTGAIIPAGDHVAIDANICAGCGACAAVCPTGAASYALPPVDALMRRLRALLLAFREAGGDAPVLLLHDGAHGESMIDALARFGDGLPARVLPLRVNEITQIGPEFIAAAFAHGAAGVRILARGKPHHDQSGLARVVDICDRVLAALGYGAGAVATIATDDPDMLATALAVIGDGRGAPLPSSFLPMGDKRGLLTLAFGELHRVAPQPVPRVALPAGAPFGTVVVDNAGCTLCLACVAACPTHALTDNPDMPQLGFTESLCVQCGLCKATCPEKVIALVPQIDFDAWRDGRRVLKEEAPALCPDCGKAFGTRSSLERVRARLADRHWMFQGENRKRLDLLMLCETCRVTRVVEDGMDPYAARPRPRARTTEDYLRERATGTDDLGES
jgi:ferredoxin